jgi:hypothetical protein
MLGTMSLSLIVGPPNSGRAGEAQARFLGSLHDDPVLVVPTADDAARFERDLCAAEGALVGGSVQTFHGLVSEIGSATGAELCPSLTATQRLALVRAVARETPLRVLSGSAARAGFAPALERLIDELQGALVEPWELRLAAAELDGGDYEAELATLYGAYLERRDAAGREDPHSAIAAATGALRSRPEAWGSRPAVVYGFDDLT